MSASLVGSEMCIRDRRRRSGGWRTRTGLNAGAAARQGKLSQALGRLTSWSMSAQCLGELAVPGSSSSIGAEQALEKFNQRKAEDEAAWERRRRQEEPDWPQCWCCLVEDQSPECHHEPPRARLGVR
eukprot:12856796-Alexandrium_andersonii.AAC.1